MTKDKDLTIAERLKAQLNIPKTETRIILNDWQEAKTSKLSAAARAKVVNRSGSNYVSENQEGYGPCRNSICGCSCSSETCTCKSASV
jgi:predicted carbohydrate-binding protein with CBM5 and CBM33 domain